MKHPYYEWFAHQFSERSLEFCFLLIIRKKSRDDEKSHGREKSCMAKPGKIKSSWIWFFLVFKNFVVSFGLPLPFHSEATVAQRHAWRGSGSRCLKHVSARPTCPAMPHGRSGASLGETQLFDFDFLVVRFGLHLALPLPLAELTSSEVQAYHIWFLRIISISKPSTEPIQGVRKLG